MHILAAAMTRPEVAKMKMVHRARRRPIDRATTTARRMSVSTMAIADGRRAANSVVPSSLMHPAAVKLAVFLQGIAFSEPGIPVLNNVDVRQEKDPAGIRDALVRQAASPVRWVEIVRAMAEQGVTHVVECGPGKVLAGLVKRIDPKLTGIAAADRASLELALATIKGA